MIKVDTLLERLEESLLDLLPGIKAAEWHAPTLCEGWSVKDIVAHMLDGQLRRLSIGRDGYRSPRIAPPGEEEGDLLVFLNGLNKSWVEAAARISPTLLVELHRMIGPQYVAYLSSLDPTADATFAVDWAGEARSQNWMDVARDYTEQWLHQQQIRDALKRPNIMTEEFYRPVLDIWMLALPHAYRDLRRPNGTSIEIVVSGKLRGSWWLIMLDGQWQLSDAWDLSATAKVKIDSKDAWKVLGKNYRGETALATLTTSGDEVLANHFADVAAVMA